jgi:hypothetical protein
MANRALVVSERSIGPEPFVPGRHYVSAALADLPDTIRYYLASSHRRARADRGTGAPLRDPGTHDAPLVAASPHVARATPRPPIPGFRVMPVASRADRGLRDTRLSLSPEGSE